MFQKVRYTVNYFKYLKNPLSCLLFKFGLKKDTCVKLKKFNYNFKIDNVKRLDRFMNYIGLINNIDDFIDHITTLDLDSQVITIQGIKILNPEIFDLNMIFYEYFLDYYDNFDIDFNNKFIIDIGANAGDSALYFASKGAKVLAFEPVREIYDIALKNIELNPDISNNIDFYNLGVSYKTGKINISAMDSVSDFIDKNSFYEVDIISLEDILNKYHPNFLKMDCEGCEFEIILNTDLSEFDEILFEHHSKMVGKDYKLISDKLNSEGFKIKTSTVFNQPFDELGLVYAYK